MGKRKHKSDDKDIRRKIRRLEDKLRHNERKDWDRRPDSSSSCSLRSPHDYEPSFDVDMLSNDDFDMLENQANYDSRCGTPQLRSSVNLVHTDNASIGPLTPSVMTPAAPPAQPVIPVSAIPVQASQVDPVDTSEPSTSALPSEILSVLGEAKNKEQPLGEHIPTELSERWGKILVDGLANEQKEFLVGKMPIPGNFLLAQAPKLNQEMAAVLQDAVINRDKRLEKAQNQLGFGIAGLATLTNDLIKGDLTKLENIKRVSEITQILLDLHFEGSLNRKKLILPQLNKKFWNAIQGAKRDAYLFGERLGECVKNTKDIERSGQQIKRSFVPQPVFQQRKQQAVTGNFRAPPRQQYVKTAPAAPSHRYHEPQPSTSARRSQGQQRRGRPYATGKTNDRRRRY